MIYLTNQEENMNKVLVFTNEVSWRIISDKIRDRVEWNPYPNGNNPVMECSSDVYLVYDSIDDIRLNHILDNYSDDYFYILIHTSGRQIKDFTPWKNRCYILKGKHENTPQNLYNPVFDIITDKEGDKQNRIIKSVFVKNAITVLVDECNVPHNMKPNESNAFRAIYQMKEFRKELEEFTKKYEASDKLMDYKEDLECLQNKIRNC